MTDLTLEAIDEMEAGWQMNELIEIHVMGGEKLPRGYAYEPYSEQIEYAMGTVKKIKETATLVSMEAIEDYWLVEVWFNQASGSYGVLAEAAELRLAICRAVLKAVIGKE